MDNIKIIGKCVKKGDKEIRTLTLDSYIYDEIPEDGIIIKTIINGVSRNIYLRESDIDKALTNSEYLELSSW